MKTPGPEMVQKNEPGKKKQNKSNTITMLFYVVGVFAILAVGLCIIYLRSRG